MIVDEAKRAIHDALCVVRNLIKSIITEQEAIMPIPMDRKEYILKRIETLPYDKLQEVIDFIDFLQIKSQLCPSGIDDPSLLIQQDALTKFWDAEEDLYEL